METIQHAADNIAQSMEQVDTRQLNARDWKNIALVGMPIVAIASPWLWNKVKNYLWKPSAYDSPGEGRGSSLGLATDDTHPGKKPSMTTKLLEKATGSYQQFKPIGKIHQHLCGIHLYAEDPSRQVIAHHFCSCVSEDMYQCVIYDSAGEDARLIGIEYVISEDLFKTLPQEEKALWHSHVHEVRSGQLVLVDVPDTIENQFMKKLVRTYGKTFHTWQFDRGDELPIGLPQLMISTTSDGQLQPELLRKRDNDMNIDIEQKKKMRQSLPEMRIDPMADYVHKHGPVKMKMVKSHDGREVQVSPP